MGEKDQGSLGGEAPEIFAHIPPTDGIHLGDASPLPTRDGGVAAKK